MRDSAERRADAFLRVAHLYRLGILPTERPHPRTRELSHWARHDLPLAVETLKRIDLAALRALERRAEQIDGLTVTVRRTLARGRRVFLCGCGATGRLALSLEWLWRRAAGADGDRVVAFMAGGDVALVHALEGFEDQPAYGARHLEQLGFAEGDLLVACTEGGETPYVIGATARAAQISSNAPWFLYCNPDGILARRVERFRLVRDNAAINRLCLSVGPMALAGSTRMQASTVLQLAVGLALLQPDRPAREAIADYRSWVASIDLGPLADLVDREAAIYEAGDHVTYRVADLGPTVLTDTTERAPTFSLVPFDQLVERLPVHSLCYVALDDAGDAAAAWRGLLGRAPRSLDWPEVDPRTTAEYLGGFDFSRAAVDRRRRQIPDRRHHEFRIRGDGESVAFALDGLAWPLPAGRRPDLYRHLLLKQVLNIHSTLVMGRLGRYEGNLMTWVTPTNGKLVDRAARYVGYLLSRDGSNRRSYAEIVHAMFAEMARTAPGEPVVLRTYGSLRQRSAAG